MVGFGIGALPEREGETDRQRERETERERQTDTDRHRHRPMLTFSLYDTGKIIWLISLSCLTLCGVISPRSKRALITKREKKRG